MRGAIIMTVVASWYLVGLSITVALVVYPSFDLVGTVNWAAFHHHHVPRITWAVGAPWVAQVLGLVLWLTYSRRGPSATWWWCALFAVLALVVTVVGALPPHRRLTSSFDPRWTRALRRAHRLRTASWLVAAVAATAALASS